MAAAASPLRRLGAPLDTAEVVSFLAGDGGAWITGQHMLVNGGATM
ncbi:SDR family oxidoreductase [uncultured Roseobacter sp.]